MSRIAFCLAHVVSRPVAPANMSRISIVVDKSWLVGFKNKAASSAGKDTHVLSFSEHFV
jgi:hypothetical protein